MKTKWKRWISISLAVLVLGPVFLDVGLHVLSSRAWTHRKLAEKLAQTTGREVRLGHLTLNLRGAFVDDFAMAKPGGFAQGEMLHVKQARVKVSLWHLLHGQLYIKDAEVNGLSFHIVRDEQGKLNTDFSTQDASVPPQPEENPGAPFDVAV